MTNATDLAARFPLTAEHFPDYDLSTLPDIPADWQESAWHHDAAPFWMAAEFADETAIRILVDYADPAQSEYPDLRAAKRIGRYQAGWWDDWSGESHGIADGDDFPAIVAAVAQAKRIAAEGWRPHLAGGNLINWTMAGRNGARVFLACGDSANLTDDENAPIWGVASWDAEETEILDATLEGGMTLQQALEYGEAAIREYGCGPAVGRMAEALTSRGFAHWDTGGGGVAYGLHVGERQRFHVLVTDAGGMGLPSAADWLIGAYDAHDMGDHSPTWERKGGLGFEAALNAALDHCRAGNAAAKMVAGAPLDETDLKALAKENDAARQPCPDLRAFIRAEMDRSAGRLPCEAAFETIGLSREIGGGGSVFASRYWPTGWHIWATGEGGQGWPTEGDWRVCIYPAGHDGEALQFDIQSGGEFALWPTLRAAVLICDAVVN